MHRLLARSLLCLAVFTLAACPGPVEMTDAGPEPADAPALDAPVDASADTREVPDAPIAAGDLTRDYCTPLATQICASAERCGCGAIVPGGTLDLSGCVSRWTARCLEAWQPFVDAGAAIDQGAASACVAALETGTPECARPDGASVFAVCAPFAIEDAALGEACTTPYCGGGAGACVGGVCVARGAAGATCDDMFFCGTGLSCNEGTCTAFQPEGGLCDTELDCAPPYHCRPNEVSATCQLLQGVGVVCGDATDCEVGLRCEGGVCADAPATCLTTSECGNRSECGGLRSCTPRRGLGSDCREDRDCEASLYCGDASTCVIRPTNGETCARGTLCAAGLGCTTDGGSCAPLPVSGAPCAFGEFGPTCAEGFACLSDTMCGPLPVAGEPCAAGNLCAAGLGCDFGPSGSTCIVPRTEGGSCESDRSCADAFHCGPAGTCAADLPAGAPCSVGNECSGVCAPSASGGLSCADAPGAGDPCIFSDECPDALTCAATTLTCLPEICREL